MILSSHTCRGLLAVVALAVVSQLAQAQAQSEPLPSPGNPLQDLMKGIFGGSKGNPAPVPPSTAAQATSLQAVLEPSAEALNELKVDRQCVKVEERFDVWTKATTYAGENAQRRLEQLVASDFRHDQLTESDKRFLKYLAYTTVWIPAPVESAVGKLWSGLSARGDDQIAGASGRTQKRARERIAGRLGEIHRGIESFPGAVNLVLDPELRDGAFARVGGMVVLSPRFLGLMDEKDEVRDVVLAHELSHLYKRHSVKELQYQLISSAAGFSIAKKLLGKVNPSASPSLVPEFVANMQAAHELFNWIRETQVRYTKDQELEADACALRWLSPLGIEARQAWQVFGAVLGDADAGEAYVTLHPSPEERTANIERALRRVPATAPPKK